MTDQRELIREIFLQHGFTIKDGHDDLKPYVYEAAEALIEALSPAQAELPGDWEKWIQENEQIFPATPHPESEPVGIIYSDDLREALRARLKQGQEAAGIQSSEHDLQYAIKTLGYGCWRHDDAGGTPGYTLYYTSLGAHGTWQLYRNEAEALFLGLSKALGIAAPTPSPDRVPEEMVPVPEELFGQVVDALFDRPETREMSKKMFSLTRLAAHPEAQGGES